LAFILIFFGKNVLPIKGNFIAGIDVGKYFFWHAQFIKEQFLSGSIPLWNPYSYCGHPFIANPQTFIFYPSTLLFLALPLPWAFNIDTLLHFYLAAMGIYCFVHIITQSRSAGLAAAVVFSLSGYLMDNIYAGHLPMLHTAALLPWIFYFIEKAYKSKRPIFLLISGLVFGLQILSGEPQNNYYTILFLTIYFFSRHFFTSRPLQLKSLLQAAMYFSLVPVIAFGVSAIQIIPSLEFMSFSDRAHNTYDFATFMSFPPRNFFTFLVPKPIDASINTNWEFSGYFGILSVVLAGIGVVFSKHRRHTLCLTIILLIAITIMLGRYSPVYRFYYSWLPYISTFRMPARSIVIVVFCMSVLAGFGVQCLCESPFTRKQYGVTMAGLVILLLCILSGAKVFRIPIVSKEILFSISFTVSAFVILNLIRFLKNKKFVTGLIMAGLFIDLYTNYSSQIPILNQEKLTQRNVYEDTFEKDPGFYRVNVPFATLRGMKFHYYGVNGYSPIVLDSYYHFVHSMAELPTPQLRRHTLHPQLFTQKCVFRSKILGIKYAMAQTNWGVQLLTTDRVMPRAVLVSDAMVLPQLEEHLRYLKKPDFDPQKQVLLESSPHSNTPSVLKTDRVSTKDDVVTIIRYRPNRIELKSVSNNNTYLILSELFYPGWRAYVDAKRVPILRANFLLRAIALTPGRHEIVFVYRPVSFLVGAALSLLTLLLSAVLCLRCRKGKVI
jgi:hypothetical protein